MTIPALPQRVASPHTTVLADMKATVLHRHWRRRLQELSRAVARLARRGRRDGAPDQVHELRVSLRRLRLYANAGRRLLPPDALAGLSDWARGVSRVTSPIRDLDVVIEWLQARPGATRAIAECQARRARLWTRQQRNWRKAPRTLRSLKPPKPRGKMAPRLDRRVAKLTCRYQTELRRLLPRFFVLSPADQHDCRRTLRRWRYLHELHWKRMPGKPDLLLRQLILAQEATGDRQNVELVVQALAQLPAPAATRTLQRCLRREQGRLRKRIEVAFAGMQRWLALAPAAATGVVTRRTRGVA